MLRRGRRLSQVVSSATSLLLHHSASPSPLLSPPAPGCRFGKGGHLKFGSEPRAKPQATDSGVKFVGPQTKEAKSISTLQDFQAKFYFYPATVRLFYVTILLIFLPIELKIQ